MKDIMTKKQQWIAFTIGVILIIIYGPPFLQFWSTIPKPVKIITIISCSPIFLIIIFSKKIMDKNPKLFKLITGYDVKNLRKNGVNVVINKELNKFLRTLFFSLIIILIGIVVGLFIRYARR